MSTWRSRFLSLWFPREIVLWENNEGIREVTQDLPLLCINSLMRLSFASRIILQYGGHQPHSSYQRHWRSIPSGFFPTQIWSSSGYGDLDAEGIIFAGHVCRLPIVDIMINCLRHVHLNLVWRDYLGCAHPSHSLLILIIFLVARLSQPRMCSILYRWVVIKGEKKIKLPTIHHQILARKWITER
jgi:hypothetical protein